MADGAALAAETVAAAPVAVTGSLAVRDVGSSLGGLSQEWYAVQSEICDGGYDFGAEGSTDVLVGFIGEANQFVRAKLRSGTTFGDIFVALVEGEILMGVVLVERRLLSLLVRCFGGVGGESAAGCFMPGSRVYILDGFMSALIDIHDFMCAWVPHLAEVARDDMLAILSSASGGVLRQWLGNHNSLFQGGKSVIGLHSVGEMLDEVLRSWYLVLVECGEGYDLESESGDTVVDFVNGVMQYLKLVMVCLNSDWCGLLRPVSVVALVVSGGLLELLFGAVEDISKEVTCVRVFPIRDEIVELVDEVIESISGVIVDAERFGEGEEDGSEDGGFTEVSIKGVFGDVSGRLLCNAERAIDQAAWEGLMVRWRAVGKICIDHMYPLGSCVSCGDEKQGGGVYEQDEECGDCERLRLGYGSD